MGFKIKVRSLETSNFKRISSKNLLLLSILSLVLFNGVFFCITPVKADSIVKTTILGYNMHLFFKPEPGTTFLKNITAVIKIEGNFTGSLFVIRTCHFQVFKGSRIIKESYEYDDIHLSNLSQTWQKEILINLPESNLAVRTYHCEFTIEVYWKQHELSSEQIQEIIIEGDFNVKQNVNLLEIQLFVVGLCIIFFTIGLGYFVFWLSISFISAIFKPFKPPAKTASESTKKFEFKEELKLIQIIGELGKPQEPQLDKSIHEILPGEISLYQDYQVKLIKQKKLIEQSYQVKEEQRSELIKNKQIIKDNSLYKLVSSWFLKASRKRESYSRKDEETIQLLQESLREGTYIGFETELNCQLAFQICTRFLKEEKEDEIEFANTQLHEQGYRLAELVRDYHQSKTRYKTDELTLQQQMNKDLEDLENIGSKIKKINSHVKTFRTRSYWRRLRSQRQYIKRYKALQQYFNYLTIDTGSPKELLQAINRAQGRIEHDLNLLKKKKNLVTNGVR